MTRILLILGWILILGIPPGARGDSAVTMADSSGQGDLTRLRAHLRALTRLGPRPSGSAANARAAEYLAGALRTAGFEARISEGEGRDSASGTWGRVRNVVGWLPATEGDASAARNALLLASHYDSVVDGPGGADNAASVAALLVSADDLGRSQTRRRPVIVLFSDAEERYLLGADQFVREDPLAARVGGVINFDHAGRAGPLYNFEAGPRSRAMQEALWSLPGFSGAPRSFSFATDVYRVLPFDTDFTVLSRLRVPGLNFGLVRDGYVYHTADDRGEGVPDVTLLAIRRTVAGLTERLVVQGGPLVPEKAAPDFAAFFPVAGLLIRLTPTWLLALTVASVLLAAATLAVVARRDWRGLARGLAAVVLSVPVTLALTLAAVAGLRAVKGVDQVAYASPWPFFLLLGSLAVVSSSFIARWLGASRLPPSVRLGAVLVPWAVVAQIAAMGIPSSSLLFVIPAAGLALAALLVLRERGRGAGVLAAILVGASVLLAWAEPLAAVLPFLMTTLPKSGPEPLVFWPCLITLLGLFLAPLPWALSGQGRVGRWTLMGAGIVGILGAAFVLVRPAYDRAHAQRVWAYHVTAPDTAYEVFASTDRLGEPGETLRPGREAGELFWIGAGWSRTVRPATKRTPSAKVSSRREGERLFVEAIPPPGADIATLILEGAEIAWSDPPAARLGRRTTLRRIVAGIDTTRFEAVGLFPRDARARLMCTTPRLPADVLRTASRSPAASRTLLERTIAVVDVPLP